MRSEGGNWNLLPLYLDSVVYPEGHPRFGGVGPVYAFLLESDEYLVLVDTGIGPPHPVIDRIYKPTRRDLPTALSQNNGIALDDISAVILTLVRDKKVALEDPLSKWVPGVPKTDGVTVKMLMNHTSGIFNYTETREFAADPKKKWTPRAIVDLATANDPYFAPGKSFHYSNTNYVLLGMVAEAAGGAKISALIRARALEPAGLKETFLDGEETLVGTLATGFSKTGKDVTLKNDMSGPWAAGAMAASGKDLCDWVATLYGERKVLGDAEIELLAKDAVVLGLTQEKYGLGVQLTNGGKAGPGWGHGGAIDGFYTSATWYPDKRTAVCAVVNQDGADPDAVAAAAVKALF